MTEDNLVRTDENEQIATDLQESTADVAGAPDEHTADSRNDDAADEKQKIGHRFYFSYAK